MWFPLLAGVALATPPSAEDLVSLAWVGGLQVSPDGKSAIFRHSKQSRDGTDEDAWSREAQLWWIDLASGETRVLTQGDNRPWGAAWSPDGSAVAFLRSGDEGSVLNLLPMDGGEPRIVALPHHIGQWAWDGPDAIVYSATPEADEDDDENAWRVGGAWAFDQEWDNARVYAMALDAEEAEALTPEDLHIADWEWDANHRRLLATVAPSSDPYVTLSDARIVLIDGEAQTVLEADPDCTGPLAWSDDGRFAAWAVCEDTLSIPHRIGIRDVEAGQTRQVLEGQGLTTEGLGFSAKGDLHVLVGHEVQSRVAVVDPESGRAQWREPAPGVFRGLPQAWKKGEVVVLSETDRPTYVGAVDRKGEVSTLFDPNPHVAEWTMGVTERVRWSHDEAKLDGLLHRPHGAEGPTPLLVMPHGGPDGVSALSWRSWVRYFTGLGYSVFQPNYRGGVNYGIEHYAANRGRLGEIEFMDIEAGVDSLIEAGLADPEQLYYGGWSWGGYLTAWTVGHTDRYRAAMAGAAVVDVVNQYVTSDINHGQVAEWEYTARPWTGLDRYDAADPSRFLGNVTTPTLVLHGDADTRVPFAQGLTLYRALVDQEIDTALWVYPGEGHGLSNPAHNVHRMEVWAEWMSTYAGDSAAE